MLGRNCRQEPGDLMEATALVQITMELDQVEAWM